MSEFKLINKYIKRAKTDDSVILGIGDDAAVMTVPEGHQIVQTMDTMVLGTHFDRDFSADALAHKLLHVNLSDIAAMGAVAKWATVALSMPDIKERWIAEFSAGLQDRCGLLGINLVGGDTTTGGLSVTMNLTGLTKNNQFLRRNGAKNGDDIYVSGFLGDAALALTDSGKHQASLLNRLRYPEARFELGEQLVGIASACLDVSDGLLVDLQHICNASDVSAEINVEDLLLSKAYQKHFEREQETLDFDFALNGGDDYELCFTVPQNQQNKIKAVEQQLDYPITKIGRIVSNTQSSIISCQMYSKPYICQRKGWEHFSD